MATATPLSHPKEPAQVENHFRFRVAVKRMGRGGSLAAVSGLSSLKAAYGPDASTAMPQMFQGEAAGRDQVLILGWYENIAIKDTITLTRPDGDTEGDFLVDDVAPANGVTRTLLTVSPVEQ